MGNTLKVWPLSNKSFSKMQKKYLFLAIGGAFLTVSLLFGIYWNSKSSSSSNDESSFESQTAIGTAPVQSSEGSSNLEDYHVSPPNKPDSLEISDVTAQSISRGNNLLTRPKKFDQTGMNDSPDSSEENDSDASYEENDSDASYEENDFYDSYEENDYLEDVDVDADESSAETGIRDFESSTDMGSDVSHKEIDSDDTYEENDDREDVDVDESYTGTSIGDFESKVEEETPLLPDIEVDNFMIIQQSRKNPNKYWISLLADEKKTVLKEVDSIFETPIVSPDGKTLCFCRRLDREIDILKFNLENLDEDLEVIANNVERCEFSIKPTSDGIVMTRGKEIISIPFDSINGSRDETVFLTSQHQVRVPTYSQDGLALYFVADNQIHVKTEDQEESYVPLIMEDDIDISDPIYLQVSKGLRIILKYNYKGEKLDILIPIKSESYAAGTISIYNRVDHGIIRAVDAFFSKNGKYFYVIAKSSENKMILKVGRGGKLIGHGRFSINQSIFLK